MSADTTTRKKHTSPVIILLSIVFLACGLTYVIDSGQFQRENGVVVYNVAGQWLADSHDSDNSQYCFPSATRLLEDLVRQFSYGLLPYDSFYVRTPLPPNPTMAPLLYSKLQ